MDYACVGLKYFVIVSWIQLIVMLFNSIIFLLIFCLLNVLIADEHAEISNYNSGCVCFSSQFCVWLTLFDAVLGLSTLRMLCLLGELTPPSVCDASSPQTSLFQSLLCLKLIQ